MNKINICISCDDAYAPYAGVVIVSALLNSNIDEYFDFYILEHGLSAENKQKLRELEKIKPCSIKIVNVRRFFCKNQY